MATWDETRLHVQSKYKVTKDEPGWIGLTFAFTIDKIEMTQRERIEPTMALGKPALLLWSDIADVGRVPHKLALQRNMGFEIGAIAISGDLYVLRVVLPFEGLSMETLDTALVYVAREAARLREGIPSS